MMTALLSPVQTGNGKLAEQIRDLRRTVVSITPRSSGSTRVKRTPWGTVLEPRQKAAASGTMGTVWL